MVVELHERDGVSGLPWEATAAGEPGGEGEWHVHRRLHGASRGARVRGGDADQVDGTGDANSRPRGVRDCRAAAVLECSRPWVHVAGSFGSDAVGRRGTTHPVGNADRIEAAW